MKQMNRAKKPHQFPISIFAPCGKLKKAANNLLFFLQNRLLTFFFLLFFYSISLSLYKLYQPYPFITLAHLRGEPNPSLSDDDDDDGDSVVVVAT